MNRIQRKQKRRKARKVMERWPEMPELECGPHMLESYAEYRQKMDDWYEVALRRFAKRLGKMRRS